MKNKKCLSYFSFLIICLMVFVTGCPDDTITPPFDPDKIPPFLKNKKSVRLAVYPFENQRKNKSHDWIGNAFAETISVALSQVKKLIVIERVQLEKLFEQQNINRGNPLAVKVNELFKSLNADVVVFGSYYIVKNDIRVVIKFIDVEKNEIVRGYSFTMKGNVPQILELIDLSSLKISMAFGMKPTQYELNRINQITQGSTTVVGAYQMFTKGLQYFNLGQYSTAISFFNKALQLDSKYYNAKIYLGKTYLMMGKHSEANRFAYDVMKEVRGKDKEYWLVLSYNLLGNINYSRGQYSEALKYFNFALGIIKSMNYYNMQVRVYNNVGAVYTALKQYSNALNYYNDALKLNTMINNKVETATVYKNMAGVYILQNNRSLARSYLNNALTIESKIGYKNGLSSTYNNLGYLYMQEGNYSRAISEFQKAINISQSTNNKEDLIGAYYNIAICYEKKGNRSQAIYYMENAVRIAREISSPDLYTLQNYLSSLKSR